MAGPVCIIQGHPHGTGGHLCHALAAAYARGAEGAGRTVETVDAGRLAFAVLRDPAEFRSPATGAVAEAQAAILRARHLALFLPLWLGGAPALLKAFLEQLGRADFLLSAEGARLPKGMLRGRSARIVVTMGMPALAYRLIWGAAGIRTLRGGILGMAGVAPIRTTYIGGVEGLGEAGIRRWLARMEALGRAGL